MSKDKSTQLPSRAKDETGNPYGKLTVIAFSGVRNESAYWLCRCNCGQEVTVRATHLRRGITKSCGCSRYKVNGLCHTPEYRCWESIRYRCHNPNSEDYYLYGAKGIAVCERWRNSFLAFYEDMGQRPPDKNSIDRIDGTLGYSPGNCRWATAEEQSRNRKVVRFITHAGYARTIPEWSRIIGIAYTTLRKRLNSGWSVERTLTTPVS